MKLRPAFFQGGIIFLLMIPVLFNGCRKETKVQYSPSDTTISVREAKILFRTHIAQQADQADNEQKVNRKNLPRHNRWAEAFIKRLSIGNAVVVPLQFPKGLYMKRKGGKVHLSLSEISWMLFYRDRKRNMQAEVVTFLPDNAYFEDTSKLKKFTGTVIIENWKGHFIRGFHYGKTGILPIVRHNEVKLPP